ncbi:MAG: T9SS type A sorting domain-containing protein [Bacteroidales bacterium]|nr:T9SS type A sorting domain-containing protein [Bacteroidales bacterium]
MKKSFLVLVSFALVYPTAAQIWVRTYGDSTFNTQSYRIIEHYDHGYFISAQKYNSGVFDFGWLLKTDINGFPLWNKTFGDMNSGSPLIGIDNIDNGGLIMVGQTANYNQNWAAYVVKLNACGEKDWCRLYRTPGRNVYGLGIQAIPGGGSIIMLGNWGTDWNKDLWLLRLDENGDIVWQQAYGLSPLFDAPEGNHLFRTLDTNFVITDRVFSPDSGQTNQYRTRPMIIRVSPDGTALFELAWGTAMNFKGYGWASCDDKKGNLLSVVQSQLSSPPYTGPCLIRTSKSGNPLQYKNLVDTAIIGGATTINWFADSTLAIGLIWKQVSGSGEPFIIGAMKTDSLGNKLKFKQLIYDGDQPFNDAVMSYDNKVMLINSYYQTNTIKTFAFKLNSNLDYDSIYTHPFIYDSLCPHPVVSDTTSLISCHVVHVGLDEPDANPETTKLKIFPNPASRQVTIELPRYLVRKSAQAGVTITTVYHQWDKTTLTIYDLTGRSVYSEKVTDKTGEITLDVSAWHAGVYCARLVFNNAEAAGQRFIVGY